MENDSIKLAKLLFHEYAVTLYCKKGSFIHDKLNSQTSVNYVPIGFLSRKFSLSMLFSVRKEIIKRKIKHVVFFGASELKTLYFSFLGLDLNLIVRHGTTKTKPKTDWFHQIIYSSVNTHVALSKHLLNNVKMIVPDIHGVIYH